MATILAIFIAVFLDRYVRSYPGGKVLQNIRSSAWLNPYLAKCISLLEKISIKQTPVIILSAILPLCILLFFLKVLFGVFGEGLGQFLFTTLTLFYFLGNLDVEEQPTPFVLTHETSFAVLFWYSIFGFSGAFLYWFLVIAKQTSVLNDPINSGIRQGLILLHALAAWIPARITGFIYALAGNFDPGFKCWLSCVRDPKMLSSQVLQSCGQSAASSANTDDELRLINRAFIAWVVLVVIVVML